MNNRQIRLRRTEPLDCLLITQEEVGGVWNNVPQNMLTLSPDGGELWVQERDGSAISVIDTETFERVDRLAVGNKPAHASSK